VLQYQGTMCKPCFTRLPKPTAQQLEAVKHLPLEERRAAAEKPHQLNPDLVDEWYLPGSLPDVLASLLTTYLSQNAVSADKRWS
jgi:hypothetical protein